MLLKNNSARLITVNGPLNERGERSVKYQIKPGKNPAVEVPNELCKSAFVKSLIDNGSLVAHSAMVDDVELQGSPVKPDLPGGGTETQGDPTKPDLPGGGSESLYADFDKAQLIAQCEARDIEIGSRDTKNDLVAKLEEADK